MPEPPGRGTTGRPLALAAALLLAGLLLPAVRAVLAHGVKTGPEPARVGEYVVALSLQPEFPAAGRETRLFFRITDKITAKAVPGLALRALVGPGDGEDLPHEDRGPFALAAGEAPGTYLFSYTFPRAGRYAIHLEFEGGAAPEQEFTVEAGGFGASGRFRLGAALGLIALLMALAARDLVRARRAAAIQP